jgi:hypothetical protein
MKRNDVYPSTWLKAADLGPAGRVVTIRNVTLEEVGKERERKPVMTFKETDQELIINATNWDKVVELTGEEDSDAWSGHKIKLARVQVQYGARTVDAIRVEAPDKPKLVRRSLSKTEPVAKQQDEDGENIPF